MRFRIRENPNSQADRISDNLSFDNHTIPEKISQQRNTRSAAPPHKNTISAKIHSVRISSGLWLGVSL